MIKIKTVLSFLTLLLIYNCNNSESKTITKPLIKSNNINEFRVNIDNDSVFEDAKVIIAIKDTLQYGKQNFGDLFSFKKFQDSIKKDIQEDVRVVVLYLSLINSKLNEDYINQKKYDTFYQANLDFENVRIPFYVVPKKEGIIYIKGLLKEEIILNSYKFNDSTSTRYIQLEHVFELPVYVKKTRNHQEKN